jgi:lysine-specific demethylase 8
MLVTHEVDRVPGITPEEFAERYAAIDRPLVITGAVRAWPAFAKWGPAYLRELIGDVRVRYKLSSTHQHPDFHQATLAGMFACGEATFSSFLDAITDGPVERRSHKLFTGDEQFLLRRRDGRTEVNAELAALLTDVELPRLIPEAQLYTVWNWFSGPGVRTWLHYDNNGCHNLNAQVTGQKTCLLFSPDQIESLYPFPPGGKNPALNCCAVDVDHPNFAQHPRFANARAEHATLDAGDLLFIPAWWSHTFSHLGTFNSNVNFWWKPEHPRTNATALRQQSIDSAKIGHGSESMA